MKPKKILDKIVLFCIMGLSYYGIELLYRGYSHWSMFILGGVCGILVGLLNEYKFGWDTILEAQIGVGLGIVLTLEYLTGLFLHRVLDIYPPVWDYSDLPMNLDGQISLAFAPIFIIPIVLAILVDDYYRYFVMGEEKPIYKSMFMDCMKKKEEW